MRATTLPVPAAILPPSVPSPVARISPFGVGRRIGVPSGVILRSPHQNLASKT